MKNQQLVDEIEALLLKAKTEEAIEVLVEGTKNEGEIKHENAVLLSGQFKQWKRNKMLGIEQSSGELNRIQLGVLTIMKGDDLPQTNATAAPLRNTTGTKNTFLIIGATLGFVAVLLVVWFMGSQSGTNTNTRKNTNQTPIATTTPPKESVPKENILKDRGAIFTLPISAGTDMVLEKKYYTTNQAYFLIFQNDGNLVLYKKGHGFLWGSQQDGAPKGGKFCKMQQDGNLVLLDKNGTWIWGTQTTDPSGSLGVTQNGELVVIDAEQGIIWNSKS